MATNPQKFLDWNGSELGSEEAVIADYAQRNYSKGAIDRAGAELRAWWRTPAGTPLPAGTWETVENWRNCHGLPLTRVRRDLEKRMKRHEINGIVAHRLKRWVSIALKIVREPRMQLSQMQDLGGCRAILGSIQDVQTLLHSYQSETVTQNLDHRASTFDNYLGKPKSDGYRGVHVVCKFAAPGANYAPWLGQRIEVQIRTKLQHAFATAVETVTTFDASPLKFGGGTPDWRRFFALVGSAFAVAEGTPTIPGTPQNYEDLVAEIRLLARTLRVRRKLQKWRKMLRALPRTKPSGTWLLLSLDLGGNTLAVTGFDDYISARQALAGRERLISDALSGSDEAREDAVLVSVSSILELRRAYPNYYGDTRRFLSALNKVTARRRANL